MLRRKLIWRNILDGILTNFSAYNEWRVIDNEFKKCNWWIYLRTGWLTDAWTLGCDRTKVAVVVCSAGISALIRLHPPYPDQYRHIKGNRGRGRRKEQSMNRQLKVKTMAPKRSTHHLSTASIAMARLYKITRLTSIYCNVLQLTATYCNLLQCTAIYCNVRQLTSFFLFAILLQLTSESDNTFNINR